MQLVQLHGRRKIVLGPKITFHLTSHFQMQTTEFSSEGNNKLEIPPLNVFLWDSKPLNLLWDSNQCKIGCLLESLRQEELTPKFCFLIIYYTCSLVKSRTDWDVGKSNQATVRQHFPFTERDKLYCHSVAFSDLSKPNSMHKCSS